MTLLTRYVPHQPRVELDVPCTCSRRTAAGVGRHAEHCVEVLRWDRLDAVITAAQRRLLGGSDV